MISKSSGNGLESSSALRSRLRVLRFLATVLLFAGCAEEEPRQRLVESFEDGSVVTADIQYRLDGCADESGSIDCYYYIVTLESPRALGTLEFVSDETIRLLWQARDALDEGVDVEYVEGRFQDLTGRSLWEVDQLCRSISHVRVRLYDAEGFSLYQHRAGLSRGNALEPGYNDVPDEMESFEGGLRWSGRFPGTSLPVRAFRSEIFMKAELMPVPGCE